MSKKDFRKYLTLAQAAAYVGLSVTTLRRLIRRGVLSAYKPGGGRILVKREELDAWVEDAKLPNLDQVVDALLEGLRGGGHVDR